ncbi:MAG: DNA-protecting protein DprA [Proteobacteria bacterium]|nr:DNA-protecting protein DprA [Pseudomonadota bacterium]
MEFKELQRGAAIYLWHTKNNQSSYRKVLCAKDVDALELAWSEVGGSELLNDAAEQGKSAEFRYHRSGSIILIPGDEGYPRQVYDMQAAPILCVRGNCELLKQPQIAIVGSRQTTGNSRQIAPIIAEEVISRGYVITSGGAFGIDAIAHRHAMACQAPTVVVSAIGTDKVYPRENCDIYEYAWQNGAVVTQFPNHSMGYAPNFPLRNDVIAALSFAVIIVQCGEKSGALYTAHAARKLRRTVYAAAMPGFDDKTAGGLSLIRSGHAQMLSSSDDFDQMMPRLQKEIHFEAQPDEDQPSLPIVPAMLSETQRQIVSIIASHAGMTRMQLKTSLPESVDFDVSLLELELAGVVALKGGIYCMNGIAG